MHRYIYKITYWNPSPVRLRVVHFTTVQESKRNAQAECLRHCAGLSQSIDGENDECQIKLIGTEPYHQQETTT